MERQIRIIDARGKALGRLASEAATLLMGKGKTDYAPEKDVGDFVHVKNAAKVLLTGKKMEQKIYKWHTGYLGGLKERVIRDLLERDPALVVRGAVSAMLPKNSFRTARLRRMRVSP